MIFCKTFTNKLSANIKWSKTQQYKITQSVQFLGNQSLAKSVLIALGLIKAADAGIHKTILRLGTTADNFKQKKWKILWKKVKYMWKNLIY